MNLTVPFYISLAICLAGIVFKVIRWHSRCIGPDAEEYSTSQRLLSSTVGVLATIFNPLKLFIIIRTKILDVVFQLRVLRESRIRWIMHMLIFVAFILLLVMHAFGSVIMERLTDDYCSTVNPYFFLRNLLGLMVYAGIIAAVVRRIKKRHIFTNYMDVYAIILATAIICSGVALEGLKITSHSTFMRMAEDYGPGDQEELEALESYWVEKYGLVSPNVKGPFDEEILAEGMESNENNCISCHAPSQWAFMGYAFSILIRPFALSLDNAGAVSFLYWFHLMVCFIGLAYLPFSKMFHIITTPLSLMVNAIMSADKSKPINIATKQAMELDACVHCSTCTYTCSSYAISSSFGNKYILPSEKMLALKKAVDGKKMTQAEYAALAEGMYVCTNCDRCTVVCPSGINLKELWISAREYLINKKPVLEILSQYSFLRGIKQASIKNYNAPVEKVRLAVSEPFSAFKDRNTALAVNEDSSSGLKGEFKNCFGCQTCTTVCPVVSLFESPEKDLDLLPHQIMYSVGLGLDELAMGANMIWNCTTCYQCQENCPQKVNVTDILYDLKNKVIKTVKSEERQQSL